MSDQLWLAQALQLAANGLYSTSPNPRVGCVLVKAVPKQKYMHLLPLLPMPKALLPMSVWNPVVIMVALVLVRWR